MRRKGCIFCASVLFLAGLAAAWAQEEGVILRYKYTAGQEVIYEYKEMKIVEMRKDKKTRTLETSIKGKVRDFALSVSHEGIIEMAFYQDKKRLMGKMDGKAYPDLSDREAAVLWQKLDRQGQASVYREARFMDYLEQTEIIDLPEGPIDVGDTWKSGFKDDYVAYEVLARERIGQDECFQIKSVWHPMPLKDIPYPHPISRYEDEKVIWFALDKGYVIKMERVLTFQSTQRGILVNQENKTELTLLEVKSFDEAEIASRRKQLEKIHAIQDALNARKFDQAASEINAFNTEFPESPYKEVAASQARQLEAAHQMAAAPGSLVGQPAPAFELTHFEGNSVSLADFKGKVVFLDFWATQYDPCVTAVPYVQALYEKYKDKGLVVIGMNLDGDQEAAKKFAKEKGLSYIHLFARDMSSVYPRIGMPTFFIIDREAVVRYQESGFSPGLEKEWEKEIKELLAVQGGE